MERLVAFYLAGLDFFSYTWVYESLRWHIYSTAPVVAPSALTAVVGGLLGCALAPDGVLKVLMCLEIAMAGVGLGFALVAVILADPLGQAVALLLLVLTAAEAALGLALLILARRVCGQVNMSCLIQLRG